MPLFLRTGEPREEIPQRCRDFRPGRNNIAAIIMTVPYLKTIPSAAEAGLIFRTFTARLKAAPFQSGASDRVFTATSELVPFPVNCKIKVKSVGQECPTHTGRVKQAKKPRSRSICSRIPKAMFCI
jgi:hypothetical protein